MKKEEKGIPIRDLFVKLEKYYKDMYILHGSCFCEGDESCANNPGYYFGVFEPHVIEQIRTDLPNEEVLYVESIREAKDHLDEKVLPVKNESEIKKIESKFDHLYEEVRNCDSWLPLPLTKELVQKIFSEGDSVLLDVDGLEESVVVSKSCFPGITEKRITDLTYTLQKKDHGIVNLVFRYLFEYFTIYLSYAILT